MTTTYWAPHASLETGHAASVRITVDGERIAAVSARQRPREGDVRLEGIVLPGFANAHSHAFHRALRGRTHSSTGNFWSWRDSMYAAARNLTPDRYLALARAVFGEMVVAGYTVVGEFHYLHHGAGGVPYDDPNAMGRALAQAATDAGLRLTLLDACYLAGGLDGNGHSELDEVQQRFGDGDVGRWAERHAALTAADLGPTVRVGAAAHSVRGVPEPALRELAAVTRGEVVHAHVSEQLAENSAALAFYGRTPTRVLCDAGLLRPGFCAVHATHLTDDDIRRLAESGSAVCFCPTTERDLADGIGPARRLAWSGVPLSVGSDQHAVVDPFEEVRGLELHERLMSNERGRFRLDELQHIGSAQGYTALGWPEGGRLAAGALADFVVVDLESVRTVGCRPEQVLMAAGAPDVTDVVVGGRRVVVEGRHVLLGDIAPCLSDAFELDPGGDVTGSVVVRGISQLVTNALECDELAGEARLGIVEDAAVVVNEVGDVAWFGPAAQAPAADSAVDLGGRAVVPGFVDSHTHLLYAGDRSAEFVARMTGERYDGGGIHDTVAATREASSEDLVDLMHSRLSEMRAQGTWYAEIKSGYGLTVEDEARLIELASSATYDVTFLGAHVVPAGFPGGREAYVDLVTGPDARGLRPLLALDRRLLRAEQSARLRRGRGAADPARRPRRGARPARPWQPARPRTRGATRRRARGGVGRPLHLPRRRGHRGPRGLRHRRDPAPGCGVLDPDAVRRRPPPPRGRGHRRPRDRPQPRDVQHLLHALRHRARGP